jgi:hypothetical protein
MAELVECGGLEIRCGLYAHRGFESLSLRQWLSRPRFHGKRFRKFYSKRRERDPEN